MCIPTMGDGEAGGLSFDGASRQKPYASIHPSRRLYSFHLIRSSRLGKAPPPLSKPPAMVLRLHGYGAWIESDGKLLE